MVTFALQYTPIYDKGSTLFYSFKISNSSTQIISYNLNSIDGASSSSSFADGTVDWTSGNSSGSLNPGQSVTVPCTVQCPFVPAANIVPYMFQAGAEPLLTLGGQQLQFRFWNHGSTTTEQYINICPTNGFSITEDTSSQNNATGNGFNIGLGGGGGSLNTENICIQVFDAGTSY